MEDCDPSEYILLESHSFLGHHNKTNLNDFSSKLALPLTKCKTFSELLDISIPKFPSFPHL